MRKKIITLLLGMTMCGAVIQNAFAMKDESDLQEPSSRKSQVDNKEPLFKILTPDEWEVLQRQGYFEGSPLDLKDGFIHASFDDQYQRTLDKFFKHTRPVILVKNDSGLLKAAILKIEANRLGGDEYPHVYSNIPLEAIISHERLEE